MRRPTIALLALALAAPLGAAPAHAARNGRFLGSQAASLARRNRELGQKNKIMAKQLATRALSDAGVELANAESARKENHSFAVWGTAATVALGGLVALFGTPKDGVDLAFSLSTGSAAIVHGGLAAYRFHQAPRLQASVDKLREKVARLTASAK